jgi:hypothetical protein
MSDLKANICPMTTYQDIEAEWERIVSQSDQVFPREAKATMIAFWQHTAGLPVTAYCIHCDGLLKVSEVGKGGCAWSVACPCGKSADTLRGL